MSGGRSNPRLVIAGLYGALAVAVSAFGAHGLPAAMDAALRRAFETGGDFHLAHALVLAAIALAAPRPGLNLVFALILGSSVIFSFSLYALALTGVGAFGAITPVGGAGLIAGWLALGAAGLRKN